MKKLFLLAAAVLLAGAGCTTNPSSTPSLQTYTNDQYGFAIDYPSDLTVHSSLIPPTQFEKEGVAVYIAPPADIEALQKAREVEGPPQYFLLTADVPVDATDALSCLDGTEVGKITVGGVEAIKCLRPSLFSDKSLWVSFTKDRRVYFHLSSDKYEGDAATVIDQMIASFRFTK